MSNYMWILDAGHGGMRNGKYVTAPRKMWTFEDGFVFYEGVNNRELAKRVYKGLAMLGIDFALVYDEVDDDLLHTRAKRANAVYDKNKKSIFLSIHSNSGGGRGFEIFTSPGETKSDRVAQIFCETYKKEFPDFPFRSDVSDGDLDKEEKFTVLTATKCPALLVENLFFDNRKEADILVSDEGRQRIANCILKCIQNVECLRPI